MPGDSRERADLLEHERCAFRSAGGDFSLLHGDSLVELERLPAGTVDMIFADPPYFLSNGGMTCKSGRIARVDKGAWDRSMGVEQDFEFHMRWLELCRRALARNGTIWVSGTRHIIFAVGFAMQRLGYRLLNEVVWYKKNPPPNLCCRYFTHATETILWAARDAKSRHCFNYAAMKLANGGKQMQSLWTILAPRAAEKVEGKHPTQKPLALLERIVTASTREGDLVLDPFNGSGTTGIAATRLGRRYLGIEIDRTYVDLTVRRYLAERGIYRTGPLPETADRNRANLPQGDGPNAIPAAVSSDSTAGRAASASPASSSTSKDTLPSG
jgi:site-specific DNA-methyltransferase (adenine-specific)